MAGIQETVVEVLLLSGFFSFSVSAEMEDGEEMTDAAAIAVTAFSGSFFSSVSVAAATTTPPVLDADASLTTRNSGRNLPEFLLFNINILFFTN